jgi:peptide/nickel transport system permease protein
MMAAGARGLGRVLARLPALLVILFLVFAALRLAPGDPALGDGPSDAPAGDARFRREEVTRTRILFGLADENGRDLPLPVQFGAWLSKVLRADLGTSFRDGTSVLRGIAERLPPTVLINALALLIVYAAGIAAGVVGAVTKGSTMDRTLSTLLFAAYAAPLYWVATLFVLAFGASGLDLLPVAGLHSEGHERFTALERLFDLAGHLVLPVLSLALVQVASLSRYARAGVLETLPLEYVRTARAKGLLESQVLRKHILRNALVPLATLTGTLLPAMVAGSVVVETVFSIEGMGMHLLTAVERRDYPVVMGVVLLTAVLTIVSLWLSDWFLARLDPRAEVA